MPSPHSKWVNRAAQQHLRPLGLTRKGRSRIWLDDRSWYMLVVEFQPSGFSAGSGLNVGAHFLWHIHGDLSFDLGHHVENFVPFQSEAQFVPEADRLAQAAAREVNRLRMLLTDVRVVAAAMPEASEGWPAYHRAIALGLSGDRAAAADLFARLGHSSDPRSWAVERAALCLDLQRRVADPRAFQEAIRELIQTHRCALRLPEVAVWPDPQVEEPI